jgi:serine protease Do
MIVAVLTMAMPPPAHAGDPSIDWSGIAQRIIPAVVNISVAVIHRDDENGGLGELQSFSGSGFFIDSNGTIVTNKHVVRGAFRITVTLNDGTTLDAHVVGAAAMVDIAVLKVDAGKPVPFLQLANDDKVRVGDPVLAVGNPLGLGTSASSGIVSALNRDLRNSPFDDYVQTDAAINHGNSGGPLLNTNGHVIGVNTILLTNVKNEGSNGLGFAISSTVVGYVVRHVKNPDSAPVGWIGTHVQDTTSDLAQALGMNEGEGCIITHTDVDSPAWRAGLQSGDIILDYAGSPLSDARAFMRDVALTPIGQSVPLLVWQHGQKRQVNVTISAWPHLMEDERQALTSADVQRPLPSPDLGLLVAPITDIARSQYGLSDVKGVLVVAVDQQSEAYGLGVRPGEVVERVGNTSVSAPSQMAELIRKASESGGSIALLVLWRDGPRWIALHASKAIVSPTAPRTEASHEQGRN